MIKKSTLNSVAVVKGAIAQVDGFKGKVNTKGKGKGIKIAIVDAVPAQGRAGIKLTLTLREEAAPVKTGRNTMTGKYAGKGAKLPNNLATYRRLMNDVKWCLRKLGKFADLDRDEWDETLSDVSKVLNKELGLNEPVPEDNNKEWYSTTHTIEF